MPEIFCSGPEMRTPQNISQGGRDFLRFYNFLASFIGMRPFPPLTGAQKTKEVGKSEEANWYE